MKMTQIITKLQSELDAATSPLLADARIYAYDFPTTTPDEKSTAWELRLIPLPTTETSEYEGATGWYVPFNVHIEARRPCGTNSMNDLAAACTMAEEILQVIADNRAMTISGETEAAVMAGEAYSAMKWDYGSMAQGEVSFAVVNLTACWTGPQIAPSS